MQICIFIFRIILIVLISKIYLIESNDNNINDNMSTLGRTKKVSNMDMKLWLYDKKANNAFPVLKGGYLPFSAATHEQRLIASVHLLKEVEATLKKKHNLMNWAVAMGTQRAAKEGILCDLADLLTKALGTIEQNGILHHVLWQHAEAPGGWQQVGQIMNELWRLD